MGKGSLINRSTQKDQVLSVRARARGLFRCHKEVISFELVKLGINAGHFLTTLFSVPFGPRDDLDRARLLSSLYRVSSRTVKRFPHEIEDSSIIPRHGIIPHEVATRSGATIVRSNFWLISKADADAARVCLCEQQTAVCVLRSG